MVFLDLVDGLVVVLDSLSDWFLNSFGSHNILEEIRDTLFLELLFILLSDHINYFVYYFGGNDDVKNHY